MRKQHNALAALPTKREFILKRKQPGSDGRINIRDIKYAYTETVRHHAQTHTHTLTHNETLL
jgi:hypothetical protein